MQTLIPPQPDSPAGSSTPRRTRNPFAIAASGLLFSGLFLPGIVLPSLVLLAAAPPLAAQTPAASQPTAPARKPVHRKRPAVAHPPAPQAQAAPAPVEPPPPNWPVNDPPAPATVTWDSRGLRVVASNSSLEQILNEISTDTGATVDGLGKDERIFGVYGPGQVRDVVSQLLDGTGYNVVMIGDQNRGEPLQITLSASNAVSPASAKPAAPAAPPNYDAIMDSPDHLPADLEPQQPDQPDQQDQPPDQPEPPQPPQETTPPGAPPNTPQQIQQQYEQRQQQMQQTVNQQN